MKKFLVLIAMLFCVFPLSLGSNVQAAAQYPTSNAAQVKAGITFSKARKPAPDKPDNGNSGSSNGGNNSSQSGANGTGSSSGRLPQTGEMENNMYLLGIFVLLGTLIIIKNRRRQEELN